MWANFLDPIMLVPPGQTRNSKKTQKTSKYSTGSAGNTVELGYRREHGDDVLRRHVG